MNALYCNTSGDTANLRSTINKRISETYQELANGLSLEQARSNFLSHLTNDLQDTNFSIDQIVQAVILEEGATMRKTGNYTTLFTRSEFKQQWTNQLQNPAPMEIQTEQVLRPEEVNRNLEEQEILNVRFMDMAYGTATTARDSALRTAKAEIMSAFALNRMFNNGIDMIVDDDARVSSLRAYQERLFKQILKGLDGHGITIDSEKFQIPEEYSKFIDNINEFYRTYNDAIQAYFTSDVINKYYEQSKMASSEAYKAEQVLAGYRAYLVLTNFDSALSLVLGDAVGINPYYRGVQPGKYSLDVATMKQLAVNNAEEHDATKETSKFLKALIETTPYYSYNPIRKIYTKIPDKYLGYSDFACVAAQIKDLVYDSVIANQILYGRNLKTGKLELTEQGKKCVGIIDETTKRNADQSALEDYLTNYLPNLLNKEEISLQDVLDAHRINPIKNLGIMIQIMASDYFWNDVLQGVDSSNKYLQALTTPFRNAVQSIFRGITSLENKNSINSILQKYAKNNVNDYYAWIAQNADSVQNTKFLQYYINADNQISVRELFDQQVEQQKQKIKFAINTLGRPKLYNNIQQLENIYKIADDSDASTFKFQISKSTEEKYTIVLENPISNDSSSQVTIFAPDGTQVSYEEIQNLGDVLFPFINALTGQHFSYESPYFQHYCTLVSTQEALPSLLGMASRLYGIRHLIDSTNTMKDFKNGVTKDYTKYLVANYNADLVANHNTSSNSALQLKIDPVLQDVDLLFDKKDVRTLFNLAQAKVIALGLSLSSQIKNGEGNGLGLVGLSRLVNSLPSQVKTQCLADNSAVGQMTLINTPGLYQGVYKMEEAKLEGVVTNHTDFTVAEFGTSQFLLDFVGGLMPTQSTGDRSALGNGKVALLASVNSDKSFIGRLLLDLNTKYQGSVEGLQGKMFKNFTSEDLDNVIMNDFGTVYTSIVEHINQDLKSLSTFITSLSNGELPEAVLPLKMYLKSGSLNYDSYNDFNKWVEEYNKKYKIKLTPVQIIKQAVKAYNKNKANNWKVAALSLSEEIQKRFQRMDSLKTKKITKNQLDKWAANAFLDSNEKLKQEAIEALGIIHNVLRDANFSPVLAFYENFHYSNGSSNLTQNSTLLSLVNRFNSEDKAQYYEFFNIKNYESVKSALNNGFELVLPPAPTTASGSTDTVDTRHPAIQYLRDQIGNSWVDTNNLMVYAKVSFTANGKVHEFNLTNRLSLQLFQLYLKDQGVNTLNYDFYKDFTSLRKFFAQNPDLNGQLTINPMIDKWNKMDYLFTQEFMYASVGSHISHNAKETAPMKDLRRAYEQVLEGRLNDTEDPEVQQAFREYQFSVESARFFAQHKRNVAMTASKREFLLNYLMGIPNKYNIAIIKDVKDILGNFSGLVEDGVKPYDGGCYVNPIVVLLENYSLGAERAGINKKQFGHFYNQRMAAAGILKMAGFGITNETMRHSLMDRVMCKHMMEKKWNRRLDFDSNPFQDALLYKEHIYNLLVDYDGNRINYNNGEPLYYESQVSFRVPEDGIYSIVHKSKVTQDTAIAGGTRLNAVASAIDKEGTILQKDNLGDFVLIYDPEGTTLKKGDILTESFYWERTFDNPESAIFIDKEQNLDVDGITYALKEGQYIFKDRLLDVSKNNDGQLILNLNTKDPAPTSTPIYNVVITDIVDCNYKALTELFMGYRAVDTAATDTTLELLRSFEYTPLELVTPQVGAKYLQQSELSIAYLAEAACAVGDKRAGISQVRTQDDVWQPLKYSDIQYGVTEGAIKQFAANANENKAYTDYNYEWDYYEIYSRELGIQLDKEHHADSEEVSLMNQVVSALSSRGFSTQVARNAYRAIAALTESGLRQFKGLDEYFDYVYTKGTEVTDQEVKDAKRAGAEEFIKCVKRTILSNLKNATTRDGEFIRNIATEVTKQLLQNKDLSETPVTLAGSDNLLYNKVASILASTFTNDAIKTKLQGILSVLSPSHKRMKTYAGSLLGHQDMASLIKKHGLAQQVNLLNNLTTLQLNTTYTVEYSNGLKESWTPKTPHDIYEFKNNMARTIPVGIYEDILAGRDLGHYNAYFTINVTNEDGISSTKDCSLMDLDSVRWLSEWEHYFNEYYDALNDSERTIEEIADLRAKSISILSEIDKNDVYYRGNIIPLLRNTYSKENPMPKILTLDVLLDKLISNKKSGIEDVIECSLRRMLQSDLIALSPNTEAVYTNEDFNKLNTTPISIQNLLNTASELGINVQEQELYDSADELYYVIKSKMREAGCAEVSIDNKQYTMDKGTIRVKPYEVIMSKTLKSLLGLRNNECVQDLLNNPQIFTERLLSKFASQVSKNNYSLQLKRGDGHHINILHKDQLSASSGLTSVPMVTVIENGKMFRLGENREHLYQVQPQDLLYRDSNGNDVIVTNDVNFYVDNLSYITFVFSDIFTNTGSAFNVVRAAMESSKSHGVKKWLKEGSDWLNRNTKNEDSEETDTNILGNTESFKTFNSVLKNINSLKNLKDTWEGRYLERLGNDMYSSFVKTLQHVAARIPAQSMQSFMPMVIVDYCDADINVAYVSTSQIWLQGSDYDIDAVSLAGYSLNDSGLFVGWSPYFSLKSKTILQECCKLDFPTGEQTRLQEIEDFKDEKVSNGINKLCTFFQKIANKDSSVFGIKVYKDKDGNKVTKLYIKSLTDENVKSYVTVLNNIFRNIPQYKYTASNFDSMMSLLRKEGDFKLNGTQLLSLYEQLLKIADNHNTYINTAPADEVQAMSKNLLVNSMFAVTADPINLIESQAPVDEVTKPYKKLANQAEEYKDLITFTPGNVWNKILAIHINQVGKDGISRCAVGMKAFFAATQAANYILEHGTAEQQARLRASQSTVTVWKNAGITISGLLANLRCKKATTVQNDEILNALLYVDNDHDAALVLSALMSLATDNAKELSLGNLNAGTKLIPLYIYGITQGIPFATLHKIITSDLGWTCARLFEGNFITGRKGLFDFNSVLNHLIIGPQSIVQTYNTTGEDSAQSPIMVVATEFSKKLPAKFGKSSLKEVVGKTIADNFENGKGPLSTRFSELLGFFANMGVLEDGAKTKETWTYITFQEKINFLLEIMDSISASHNLSDNVKAESLRFVGELLQYIRDVSTLYPGADGKGFAEYAESSYYGKYRVSHLLDALENLAIGAQELTQVGQVLSINNGLRSKLFEQWQFIDNLENIINSVALAHNSKNNRTWYRGDLRSNSHKPNLSKRQERLTINIYEFLTNNKYAEEKSTLLSKYLSSSYNLLDIIRNNDNFKSFIKAAVFDNAAVGALSAKFRSYNTLLQQAFTLMKATTSKDRQRIAKGVENLFDDFTFKKWLHTKNFKVKILDKQSYLTFNPSLNTIKEDVSNGDQYIDLDTQDGLANFKMVMENYVLPSIISGQDKYVKGGNSIYMSEVFQLMSPIVTDRNPIHQSATAYTLDINMAPREDSERIILNHVRGEFNRLNAQIEDVISYTNIQNETATSIDIKDLLWLYNQIVFFGKNGEQTLTSLFDEYNVSEPMSKDYRQFLQNFDYGENPQDLIYGSNVTEAELKLYTGLVLDQWSSNLEYGFVRSRTALNYQFVQKIKDVSYSSDELQEYDFVDENDAQYWGRKARYASIPNVIPPDQYANYYIRGLVSPGSESLLVHKTINVGSVPFIVDSYVDQTGNLRSSVYIKVEDGQSLGSIYSWMQTMFKDKDQTVRDMISTLFQIDSQIDWTTLKESDNPRQLANRFANLPDDVQKTIASKVTQKFILFPEVESNKVIEQLNNKDAIVKTIVGQFNTYCKERSSVLQDYNGALIYGNEYGFESKLKKQIQKVSELVDAYMLDKEGAQEELRTFLENTWNEVIDSYSAYREEILKRKQIDLSKEASAAVNNVVPTLLQELQIRSLIIKYMNDQPEGISPQTKLRNLLKNLQTTINTSDKTKIVPVTKIKTSTTQVVTQYDANGLQTAIKNAIIQKLKGCN